MNVSIHKFLNSSILSLLLMLYVSLAAKAQSAGDTIATPVDENVEQYFTVSTLDDATIARMRGKSLPAGKEEWARETLRYVNVLHVGTDGKTRIGELVCNKMIADDLRSIFLALYRQHYKIERIVLVDEYGGDDDASMRANNTSCFNYRCVPGTTRLSNHGRGLAIDVNPFYNPWVRGQKVDPATARPFAYNRTSSAVRKKSPVPIITTSDVCYKEFHSHGFTWGGAWRSSKDYQHFEKVK